jgi:hypothetical protein
MIRKSYYHRTVRSLAVVTGLVLMFDSGVVSPVTRDLSDGALRYTASVVGVVAQVPETELNRLSADLRMRDEELDRREREIDARVLASETQNRSTYVLSGILLILLALIVTNYALDIARARRMTQTSSAV